MNVSELHLSLIKINVSELHRRKLKYSGSVSTNWGCLLQILHPSQPD